MFFHEILKKIDLEDKKEPIILFMVFFLPGFLSQSQVVDGTVFNSAWFNMIYLFTVIPQILLVLYLIEKKPVEKIHLYGITNIKYKDLLYSLLYFAGIMIIVLGTGLISFLISFLGYETGQEMPLWQFNNKGLIPLIFLTCMATGYSEELFFRSYLLSEFHSPGKEKYIIFGTSLIFALGHIYQGVIGFLGTFVIGIFLASIFIKKQNLHRIAIAHGLYNFTVLMISASIV
ncbi:MAG: type II CAAX endopeptidase family protein [Spirochaetia bacterium]|jgi:membrane protease YdiL (CAAX protease family)|nr:type II CAAX endopeptidase family protein [Spirochaetia bacterium]